MKLEHYISVGGKQLRCGYTTGTCAAGAARCAAEALLTGRFPAAVRIETPAGITVRLEPEECCLGADSASCGIRKDAGDDIDVTDGALIIAAVTHIPDGIEIDGGSGIGRVTRPGLDQPVGAAAINRVPREMIAAELRRSLEAHHASGGLRAVISAPQGEELAKKTFNPRLGIEGGLSILGTSGIVRPMSRQAIIDTTRTELRMLAAAGSRDVLLVPGNYGAEFARDVLLLDLSQGAQCSNYIGEAIDCCRELGFRSVLLVGHIGKLCKLAAGVFDTHSRTADARREVFVTYAALAGGQHKLLAQLYQCTTTDACIPLLREAGILQGTMEGVTHAVEENLVRRGGELQVEAILFSKTAGVLGMTSGAKELMHRQQIE